MILLVVRTESRRIALTASSIAARFAELPNPTVPSARMLRQQMSRELRTEPAPFVIGVAFRLISTVAVPKWFTYELLNKHPEALARLTPAQVQMLGQGMASWGEVDAFACYIAGPAWRQDCVGTADIRRWAESPDPWWRRAALVSTVPLNNTARGGSSDADRTLLVCDLLKNDRDEMVVKALSWALRELAKKQPRTVEMYLKTQEGQLAPRVVREVRNKLTTGLKNPGPNRRNEPCD